MTIAALLSHHGVAVPRFVTVDGQIVFDGVAATAKGYTHVTHGSVTPVASHTFHAGEDLADAGALSDAAWWTEAAEISRHVEAMATAFPNFFYEPATSEHPPCWHGTINTGRGSFTVGIFMRRDRGLPFVSVLSKQRLGRQEGRRFVRAPHLYDSGALCVAGKSDWNQEVHTAATVTAWAAHWLAAFTEWRFTGKWPVSGLHHAA